MSKQSLMLVSMVILLVKEITDKDQLETFFCWFENESNHNRICMEGAEKEDLHQAFIQANDRICNITG